MCASQAETVGLVLQGGGALGAFEVGVIQYLLARISHSSHVDGELKSNFES
jgi:predicted acylesterase/phospholipase RssA